MWTRIAQSPSLSLWYATPQGAYVFERESILLHNMLSPWPRRGHSLLEMGCGDGLFLERFWQAGFDVTAVDRPSPLLDTARQRLNGKADIQAAAPDALPFTDNAFDYVAITSPLAVSPSGPHTEKTDIPPPMLQVRDILREALRVAAKGLLLRCWNPCSLAGLWRRAPSCADAPSRPAGAEKGAASAPGKDSAPAAPQSLWMGWRDYRALLRSLAPGCTISTGSTLFGPPPTWHGGRASALLNEWESPLPLGAVIYLRVNHQPASPLTSLPLRISSLRMKSPRPATAMERGHDPDHA